MMHTLRDKSCEHLPENTPSIAVILTGTDPENIKGGIGSAIAGYQDALIKCGLFGGLIPTFKAGPITGKWWPWLKAVPAIWRTIRTLKREGKTVVVYGHAGPRISLARESLILLWAQLCGAWTMLQLHTPHMDRYLDKTYVCLLLRLAFLPVDQVTVLSSWWQQRLAAGGFDGTVVISNPLSQDLELIARQTQEERAVRVPRNELVVLAMARLTKGKGIHLAIEAMQYLPEHVVLHVAGDGPELLHLQTQARKWNVSERVRFLGWVSGEEKMHRLREADVFCAPSKADAFSMGMIEALCHGLPVVTVRSRAISDLVKDEETGLVVEVDDVKAIARSIMKLDAPMLRTTMGAAAALWVTQELSGTVVGARIATVIASVTSEGSSSGMVEGSHNGNDHIIEDTTHS